MLGVKILKELDFYSEKSCSDPIEISIEVKVNGELDNPNVKFTNVDDNDKEIGKDFFDKGFEKNKLTYTSYYSYDELVEEAIHKWMDANDDYDIGS